MPVHRVLVADAESKVAEIEKSERIVSTELHGDALLVFTEQRSRRAAPGEKETR